MIHITDPVLISKIRAWVRTHLGLEFPNVPIVHFAPGDQTFRVYDGEVGVHVSTMVAKVAVESI